MGWRQVRRRASGLQDEARRLVTARKARAPFPLTSLLLLALSASPKSAAGSIPRDPTDPALTPPRILSVADADSVLLLDFESGSIDEWTPRPADRSHFKALAYRSDQALSGRRSLYCEIQGYEEGVPPGNEQCQIVYDLPRPVRIDSTTIISWTWWIRDTETNDGIALDLWATDGRSDQFLYTPFMSHSLHQRGPWPFDDPAGRPISHRCGLVAQARLYGARDWPPPPWYVYRIGIGVLFPIDQVLFLDDLRIGPPHGAPAPRAARSRASDPIPDPTLVCIADLDGDGRLDQFVAQGSAPPLVRLARRDGNFEILDPERAGVEAARSVLGATFADFDRDGRLDLAALTRREVLLFRGLGGGEFRPMPSIRPRDLATREELAGRGEEPGPDQLVPKLPSGVIAADLLPDHGPELLLSRTVALQMDSIYVWAGNWRWKSRPLPPPGIGPDPPPLPLAGRYRHGAAVGDVDGDLDLDLMLANTDLMVQGPAGLACESGTRLPGYGTMQVTPAWGDVDLDGDLDLFVPVDLRNLAGSQQAEGEISRLWRNEHGRFEDASDRLEAFDSRHAYAPVFEDFDLDGDLDLFFLQSAWTRKLPLRPPNIYLENDGTGRLSETAGMDSWMSEIPPARSALVYDADEDGDPDLLILPQSGGPPRLCTNMADARPAITVRVQDRRGVPHAAGASISLFETGRNGDRGRLVGYRQSGVGAMLPGCGVATFGCPSEGPFELVVDWPTSPGHPFVLRGLQPGRRLTVTEPAFRGPLGEFVSRADVARRRWADRLGGSGWQILVPLATLYGVGAGIAGYAFRRTLRGRRAALRRENGWRGLRARRTAFCILATLAVVGFALFRPVWPEHRAAALGAILAEGGMIFGATAGLAAAWLDSKRREALRAQTVDADEARASLLSALDGLSHANWLRYLGGISALTRSLAEGVEPGAVFERLRTRIASYDVTTRPQIQEIQRILPKAALGPEVERVFRDDSITIHEGIAAVRDIQSADGLAKAGPMLESLSEAAGRMHETVQSIFRGLGRELRSDVAQSVRVAVDRMREERDGVELATAVAEDLPPVFAGSGDLANILENLLANAIRAARENAGRRPARVRVSAGRLGGLVTIVVRDSGPGVPLERQAALFEARITDPDRHGRGLPYARRRLHQLDGAIRLATSSAEEGTEFEVTLRVVTEG